MIGNVIINLNRKKRVTPNNRDKYILKEGEIFKDIDESPYYQISNYGTVIDKEKGYKIRQTISKLGYAKLGLYTGYERKDYLVHRLVAKYFVSNPNNYKYVNHKDRNRSNNIYTNLEWCTQSYNVRYENANKISTFKRSNKIACYKDSKLVGLYIGSNEAATALNLNPSAIRKCLRDSVKEFRPYYGYKMRNSVKGYTFKYVTEEQYKQIEDEFIKSISK